jgi:hypothetical protein
LGVSGRALARPWAVSDSAHIEAVQRASSCQGQPADQSGTRVATPTGRSRHGADAHEHPLAANLGDAQVGSLKSSSTGDKLFLLPRLLVPRIRLPLSPLAFSCPVWLG